MCPSLHDPGVTTKLHPALVTRQAAVRLPRMALLLLCAAYVLPGLFGRDPWRGADLSAFGQMLSMAQGRSGWLSPTLGGVPTDSALLPHWLGAASIALCEPWLDAALAARLPFALLLVLTLVAVWYATFHLARSDAAQPLPFAFGGEAETVDYARAVADGALLALIATLGLLQLGHETTPELAQLAAAATFLWAMAAAGGRTWGARLGVVLSLCSLAASGAPSMAVALGALGCALQLGADRRHPDRSPMWPWVLLGTLAAAALAWTMDIWAWRLAPRIDVQQLGRLGLWFLWPAWPLAGWTVWQWRAHLGQRHLALPLLSLGVALVASIAMGGSDRALMLGLPGIAVLASFALPTLRRSASAALDWFAVFAFTTAAAVFWFYYVAMQSGTPVKAAASVGRVVRGFEPQLVWAAVLLAGLGTAAWLWLVRWRTSRHRPALWTSLVLPAGGVALCWLLLMTLGLAAINHVRSYRPLIERIDAAMPAKACVAAPDASPSLVAALEYHARRRVDAKPGAAAGPCPVLILVRRGPVHPGPPVGWQEIAIEQRPNERNEFTLVYRR